jgi:hypothetical protein
MSDLLTGREVFDRAVPGTSMVLGIGVRSRAGRRSILSAGSRRYLCVPLYVARWRLDPLPTVSPGDAAPDRQRVEDALEPSGVIVRVFTRAILWRTRCSHTMRLAYSCMSSTGLGRLLLLCGQLNT